MWFKNRRAKWRKVKREEEATKRSSSDLTHAKTSSEPKEKVQKQSEDNLVSRDQTVDSDLSDCQSDRSTDSPKIDIEEDDDDTALTENISSHIKPHSPLPSCTSLNNTSQDSAS